MNSVELWLLGKLLSMAEAETPEAKTWVLAELKKTEAATTNQVLKVVLQAVDTFLSAPAS